jgi:hypothetical protein
MHTALVEDALPRRAKSQASVFMDPGQPLRGFRDDSVNHYVSRNRGPCAFITASARESGTSRTAPQITL